MTLKKKYALSLILLTLISFKAQTQEQCVRTTDKKVEDILKDFPFNQAKRIKVVSFKSNKEDIVYEIPKIKGRVDLDKLFEVKTLNRENTSTLLDLLVNINYIPITDPDLKNDSVETREVEVTMCYLPRHAILFESNNGEVFGYIEICIECRNYKAYPDNMNIGDFCLEKYELLEDLFRNIGIVYGIRRNGIPWVDE